MLDCIDEVNGTYAVNVIGAAESASLKELRHRELT